ncbi:hypothetical protein [Kerstersia sp.]|uniref:hypothetical protein n=1 Tax=Kerstersia sp. TaxID=1930783 RepID=UPI003F908BDC
MEHKPKNSRQTPPGVQRNANRPALLNDFLSMMFHVGHHRYLAEQPGGIDTITNIDSFVVSTNPDWPTMLKSLPLEFSCSK